MIAALKGFHPGGVFGRIQYFPPITPALLILLIVIFAARPAAAQQKPSPKSRLSLNLPSLENVFNPKPLKGDFLLPMPCGLKLILRHVCIPANGYLGDILLNLGCEDCDRQDRGYMEGKRIEALSGSLTLKDLPEPWRVKLTELANMGDGRCSNPDNEIAKDFYFFIGKYEITAFQWNAVMGMSCPDSDKPLSPDDPRPKIGISWFDAIDFTRRYTEWLLKNQSDTLPKFTRGRFAYLRLPTESEWEYAAKGGHLVSESQMKRSNFFPMNNVSVQDLAVYTDPEAAKPPEKLAWIGSKGPNPLGLFDTSGNAAEMVLDPFRFSIGYRTHGAVGGFIVKGGSYLKRKMEIMPGRREEMPYFLEDGAFKSSDLGLRVVLSAIVTPRNRMEAIKRQWATVLDQSFETHWDQTSTKFKMEIDKSKDPVSEIERLVALSNDNAEKKNLFFILDLIKKNRAILEKQKAETLREIIRNALFAAESVMSYSIRKKELLQELEVLKKIKTKAVSESDLDSLESDKAKAMGTLSLCNASIVFFLQSYIHKVQDSQQYPKDIFGHQSDLILQEFSLEEILSHSLKSRLELFKKHVNIYKNRERSINQEQVLKDIIFTTGY